MFTFGGNELWKVSHTVKTSIQMEWSLIKINVKTLHIINIGMILKKHTSNTGLFFYLIDSFVCYLCLVRPRSTDICQD